jgi:DNA-binding transcriptional ArsR family regulator
LAHKIRKSLSPVIDCPGAIPPLAADDLASLADMFRLLGEPGRLRLVLACFDQARPVAELAAATGLSQSLASHHLRPLRDARILRAERRGKQVFYALADDHIRHVIADLAAHIVECDDQDPRDT